MKPYTEAEHERFLARLTEPDPETGCFQLVTRRPTINGEYPTFTASGRVYSGHRFSWLLRHGTVPEPGMVLDHLCHNTRCVNTDHLEEVTNAENIRRGVQHYAAGHEARMRNERPGFITPNRAAIQANVHLRTVRRWLAEGSLTRHRRGKKFVLISETELRDFLNSGTEG